MKIVNKPKLQPVLLFFIVLSTMFFVTGPTPASASPSIKTPYADYYDSIQQQVTVSSGALNTKRAIQLAQEHPSFESKVMAFGGRYNSVFSSWTTSVINGNPIVSLETVNVVYSYTASDGSSTNVVFKENAALTQVIDISLQEGLPNFAIYQDSTNWSGYEISGAEAFYTVPVYRALGQWNMPDVNEPSSWFCFNRHCDISMFTGLVHNIGGAPGYIAQGGTNSGLYCTFGCSYFYYAWYQWYGTDSSVKCFDKPNYHTFKSDVRNQAYNGGNSQLYDIIITDLSDGAVCSSTGRNFSQMGTPYLAEFIGERPSWPPAQCGCTSRLPKFDNAHFTGYNWININGVDQNINGPLNNGWYARDRMVNGGNVNINLWFDGSNGIIYQTWATSNGT